MREPDPRPWPGLVVGQPVSGGTRAAVWRGELDGTPVAVRRSRRSPPSLTWELELLARLDALGFVVPVAIPAADGRLAVGGVAVQRWLDGRPPSATQDWNAVAATLRQLHATTTSHAQRPGCVVVVDLAAARHSVDADLDALPPDVERDVVAVFDAFRTDPTSVIHGDPGAGNVLMQPDGSVGLIDWDESRVDVSLHDLSNLGVHVLTTAEQRRAERLSNAWEAANGWTIEPAYARRRLNALRQND